MSEQDIRELLNNLGSKVSVIAEENRIRKNRDEAGKILIKLLADFITPNDWLIIYEKSDNQYVKELMLEWGANLFPNDINK